MRCLQRAGASILGLVLTHVDEPKNRRDTMYGYEFNRSPSGDTVLAA